MELELHDLPMQRFPAPQELTSSTEIMALASGKERVHRPAHPYGCAS